MEYALVVPFLYREFCSKTLEQGDLRRWERSAKTISSHRQHDIEPYWQDEGDRLCMVEFLPSDDLEGRVFAPDIVSTSP